MLTSVTGDLALGGPIAPAQLEKISAEMNAPGPLTEERLLRLVELWQPGKGKSAVLGPLSSAEMERLSAGMFGPQTPAKLQKLIEERKAQEEQNAREAAQSSLD